MRSRGFCGFIRCVGDVKLLSEVVVVLPGGVQVPVGDDGATPKVSESERGKGTKSQLERSSKLKPGGDKLQQFWSSVSNRKKSFSR